MLDRPDVLRPDRRAPDTHTRGTAMNRRPVLLSVVAIVVLPALARAQWNPGAGQWGKTDARDVRLMTFNIDHSMCSTNHMVEGANNWCALARIVAAMKPDVLF